MPVEIRELVIKTTIHAQPPQAGTAYGPEQIAQLRRELLNECQRIMREQLQTQALER